MDIAIPTGGHGYGLTWGAGGREAYLEASQGVQNRIPYFRSGPPEIQGPGLPFSSRGLCYQCNYSYCWVSPNQVDHNLKEKITPKLKELFFVYLQPNKYSSEDKVKPKCK